MYIMPDETTETSELVQESIPEPVAVTEVPPAKPEPKKRGRKPKVPSPPTPVPTPVVAHKPKKRRTPEARLSKGERAVAAAISAAQVDRVKCIEELSKVMQMKYAKDGVLQTLDWKIGMLTGAPASAPVQAPGYPIPPQYPQPPAYPTPAHAFVPPSMRTPALPNVPQASGGAIEGIVDPEPEGEDQFLSGGGVMGGKGWV